MLPNISFVIPAFNAEPWLGQAIDSILRNWQDGDELMLVDDGSRDNTLEVMFAVKDQHKDKLIGVYANGYNRGCGESRNIGNSFVRHDLIFAFDADNVLDNDGDRPVDSLRALIDAHPDVDAVAFGGIKFFRDSRLLPSQHISDARWIFPEDVTLHNFLSRHDLPTSSANYLYRKSLWKAVPHAEGVGAMEAWTWGLRIMMHGAKFKTVPDTFYWHRQGLESLWIRDNRTTNFNTVATAQMLPYLHRLIPKDATRVVAANSTWYTDLAKRQLHLKGLYA